MARRLRSAGCDVVFAYPGGEVLAVLDAVQAEGMRVVLAKHEAAAAFMAATYGGMTGRPGVCLATLGPGATNLVSGVAHAYLDRCPVIAIAGQLKTDFQGIATHQYLDLNQLFAPITKWCQTVTAGNVGAVVDKAMRISLMGRPGPVLLQVPSDVAGAEAPVGHWSGGSARLLEGKGGGRTAYGVDPFALQNAGQLLTESHYPVLVAGLAAGPVADAVRRFAETGGVPVVTTPKGKGVIPEDHLLSAGVMDVAFGSDQVRELLDQADLVLAVGLDASELMKPWAWDCPVIHIDRLPNIDCYYQADVELAGDMAAGLRALAEGVRRFHWPEGIGSETRQRVLAAINPPGEGLSITQALLQVRAGTPRAAIITCDVGAHKLAAGQTLPVYHPNSFLVSNGLSSMGYALPAAVAAALARRDVPVLALVGDGGLGMYLGELETIVREALPVVVCVFIDETLSLIRIHQDRRGLNHTAVKFQNPDLPALARAFGMTGLSAAGAGQLSAQVAKAFNDGSPALLAIPINEARYPG
jgi:acetolactate synthase-1/2/3 large subunit